MRKVLQIVATAVALVLAMSACCSSRVSADKLARRAALRLQVDSALGGMDFRITMREMSPQRGPSRTITADYFVAVKDGVLNSYLPYFGQVYVPTIEGTEAEHVDKILACERQRNDKKGYVQMNMAVRRGVESYTYRLIVYDDGTATLRVSSLNRDAIEYEGDVDL